MASVGQKAPDFSLQDENEQFHKLEDFNGKWLVLYFYPKDDTPGCTIEAKEFSELLKEFRSLNCEIFGVSKDTLKSHCDFRDKYSLTVPLLSDPTGDVIEKYGAWGEKSNYGKTYFGIIRSTVMIDPNGTVTKIWTSVKSAGHAAKVLEFLKQSQ